MLLMLLQIQRFQGKRIILTKEKQNYPKPTRYFTRNHPIIMEKQVITENIFKFTRKVVKNCSQNRCVGFKHYHYKMNITFENILYDISLYIVTMSLNMTMLKLVGQ